jgi:hypothetical protein
LVNSVKRLPSISGTSFFGFTGANGLGKFSSVTDITALIGDSDPNYENNGRIKIQRKTSQKALIC